MTGDCHVRFGERLGGRFPRPTQLDFFCPQEFTEEELIRELSQAGTFILTKHEKCTVWGSLDRTKVSFISYGYPFVESLYPWNGIMLASQQDLVCMKLAAIASRGTKRDFIDVYWMAKHFLPLKDQIALMDQKYTQASYNIYHLHKSLVYFDDAEHDPMPRCLQPVVWEEVKGFFRREAAKLVGSI